MKRKYIDTFSEDQLKSIEGDWDFGPVQAVTNELFQTGDTYFDDIDNRWYTVLGITYDTVTLGVIRGIEMSTFDSMDKRAKTVFRAESLKCFKDTRNPILPEEYPDCILTSTNSEGIKWTRPCHRVIMSRESDRLAREIWKVKAGGELKLPDEFTEAVVDALLKAIYEGKPLDPKVVTIKFLLEWGFFNLLDRVEDLEINEENCGPLTEAAFCGRYGPMVNIKEKIIKSLSK